MHYKYPRADDFKDVPCPDFHAHSGNLILYGAGVNGLIASVLLKKMGVEFICFADSDERKWGTEYMGKPVISPQELKDKYPDVAIMVTPYHLGSVYKLLQEMGFKTLFDCLHLFLEFDTDDIEPLLPKRYLPGQFTIAIYNYMRKLHEFHVSGIGNNKSLFIFVTEKCTLKCKNCFYFIPYYKTPKDCDFNKLNIAIDRILKTGRFSFISIVGGETFLYDHLSQVINKLVSSSNVERIYPITNATVIPNNDVINSMRNDKVFVRISDYGDNSYKMEELTNLLEQEHIQYNKLLQQWWELEIEDFKRSENENQKVYEGCCKSEGFPFIVNNRLYRCQFAAHLERLDVLPPSYEDSVDLIEEPYNELELIDKINNLYKRKKYLQACKYCRGMGYMGKPIPIAEQAVGELPPLPKF